MADNPGEFVYLRVLFLAKAGCSAVLLPAEGAENNCLRAIDHLLPRRVCDHDLFFGPEFVDRTKDDHPRTLR